MALATRFGFRVHDLRASLREEALDALLLPDGLHSNEAGNRLVGRSIARAVRKAADG